MILLRSPTSEKQDRIHLPKVRSKRANALDLIELLRQLAQKFTDDQIARILIRQGHKTSTGLPFNAQRVAALRYSYRILAYKKSDKSQVKTYTAQQASQVLGVSFPTVLHWLHSGFIAGQQVTEGAPWEISLTDEQIKRLTAQDAPPGWTSLSQATKHLGVSQQTVLNWVKSGKLQYVYVSKGKRRGLRINVNSQTSHKQLHMFT